MKEITDKYNLNLNDGWNIEYMRHSGRHANDYHDFVLQNLQKASKTAGDVKKTFLEIFDKTIREPIRNNPDLLQKKGW